MERRLQRAAVFGRDAMGLAFIRSGWGKDATFISFRAGATFTHHGHYDAGHFTLFKGAPLAVTSGTYGDYYGENRLNYSIRTVAKNSLLILRPDERVRPNRFFDDNVADGGQRIELPTGSAIASVADWRDNFDRGNGFEGGHIRAVDLRDGVHAMISADLTAAYNTADRDTGGNGGKVRRVTRDLLYLHEDDLLLIRDRLETTRAGYVKKWLLHTINKPRVERTTLRKGAADNGILESRADEIMVRNGRGRLVVRRFEPRDAVVRLIGGPDYRFYVETDGDDSVLDGRNMDAGAKIKPWFDTGNWRIEIQPGAPRERDEFLIALVPGIGVARRDMVSRLQLRAGDARALTTPSAVLLYTDENHGREISFDAPLGRKRIYLAGLRPGEQVALETGGARRGGTADGGGWAMFELPLIGGARVTVTFDQAGPS